MSLHHGIYVHILLVLLYDYMIDGILILNVLHCFVNFMFVLAEHRLITYIRVIGTKGKQVPDA